MIPYLGDFAEDATVYIAFNTFDSNDPSASVTITNLADADIKVHKDGSATQIVTDGATVAIDFDSITGNHLITIDTSVHADYSIGSDYHVRMEGTTVDGATINAWVGHFSIENRFKEVTVTSIAANVITATAINADAITNAKIADDAIAVENIKDAAITAAKLAGDCITAAKIADNTIATEHIATGAITADSIAANAIGSSEIADGAITAAKIANAAIDNATFAADVGSTAYATNIIALAARKALDEIKLDHLVAIADADDVVDNAIIAKLAAKGATADWSDFVNTTDSLQALRDRGDASWATATSVTVSDKTGFRLSATGVDDILDEATDTSLTGNPSSLRELPYFMTQMHRNKLNYDKATDDMILYEDDSTTPKWTHAMTDDASDATRGKGA